MTFTNQIEENKGDVCYYRKAFFPSVFETLSLDEKRALIAFAVEELSGDIDVMYSDGLGSEIGVLTGQDVLLINTDLLLKPTRAYSLKLYVFIFSVLVTRFISRKKSFVPVIKECYLNKKLRKNCIEGPLDIIVLHLLLDELLEINEMKIASGEDKGAFLSEINDIMNRLSQTQDIIETLCIETSREQSKIPESKDVFIRSR